MNPVLESNIAALRVKYPDMTRLELLVSFYRFLNHDTIAEPDQIARLKRDVEEAMVEAALEQQS